jgi:hypothetical protein
MNAVTVYVLCDSRESDPIKRVRYVGQTTGTLKRRLTAHRRDTKTGRSRRAKWMRSVVEGGGEVAIEAVRTDATWNETEIKEIARCLSLGYSLTNGTDGGDGRLGCAPTKEHREKLRLTNIGNKYTLGYSHTSEARQKIGLASLGHIVTAETRKKIGQASLGRRGGAKLTWPQVTEIRSRCAGGKTQADVAREFRVARSCVSFIVRGKSWVAA